MQKKLIKILSVVMLLSLLVSPVLAESSAWVKPQTDEVRYSPEEQSWLDIFQNATTFIVQLDEPSLATYEGGNSLFATPERTASGKLNVEGAASQAYLSHLNGKMDSFIASAEQVLGRKLDVTFRYLNVLNAFAAVMSPEEAIALKGMATVKEVYPDEVYKLETDVSPAFVGVDKIWDDSATAGVASTKGEGIIAGIIDTGINMDHPSFAAVGPVDGYVHVNPYGAGVYKGLCASNPSNYICNSKLVGVYTYVSGLTGEDHHSHGSHTASTVAGNRLSLSYNGAAVTISGMAPHANVISYQVCSEDGCANSASTAAVNQAIADNVDVINFSIGPTTGPSRSPYSDSVEMAMLEGLKVGMISATSAGNSGPNVSTAYKSPPWALVVGNTGHGRIFTLPITVNPGGSQVTAHGLPGNGPALNVNLTGKTLVWAGSTAGAELGCSAWPAGSLTGKVLLVSRGTCTFQLKVENAIAAGAIYVIVYNNVLGAAPILMGGLDGSTITIPESMISLDEANTIIPLATSPMTVDILKDVSSYTRPEWGDKLADSSSRGPITGLDILEPDLVAPGTNVLAAYRTENPQPPYGGGPSALAEIDLMSGTSMAGPHVAGSAALMRALFPNRSVSAIRSAIIMTALAGTTADYDGSAVDAFDYGNGRLDMSKAALAGLVMEETYEHFKAANPATGGDVKTLNIPSYQNSNCLGSCTFKRTVTSVADASAAYTVAIDTGAGMEVIVSPMSFTLAPGATQEVTVTLKPKMTTAGVYQFARVKFDTDATFTTGEAISDVAFSMTAKTIASGSTLPKTIREHVTTASGGVTLSELYNASAITALSTVRNGLTPATVFSFTIPADDETGTPYDDLSKVYWTTFACPTQQQRMVIEVLSTTSSDIDLYVGTGTTPTLALQKAKGTTPDALEYLNIVSPAFSGTCWALAQSWEEAPVKLAVGMVSKTASTNYTVTGPAAVPAMTAFDLNVAWNLPFFSNTEVWYGYFTVGTSATATSDVGKVDVNLYKEVLPVVNYPIYIPFIVK